jgi:hypothetical protein
MDEALDQNSGLLRVIKLGGIADLKHESKKKYI